MKKVLFMILMLAPIAAMAQKFGHVNSQEVIQAMPEYTKAKTEIEALAQQYEADLKSMQEEMTKKLKDYEANAKTLPDNIKQRRETELQEMDQKIRQSYQDNQQALAQAQQDHHKGHRCHQAGGSGRRLCLYHGQCRWHSLHQHHTEHRRYSSGKGKTRY